MIERANPTDAIVGHVGQSARLIEGGFLHGTYHAVCEGYKEVHKTEYLDFHGQLLKLYLERRGIVQSLLARGHEHMREFFRMGLQRISEQIEELEGYLKTLTEVKWAADAPNVVTTVGANLALDTVLNGSAYTTTGPFMGLIGAVSYVSTPVIGDTMASHATWTEGGGANAPTYSGNRPTVSFSTAASGKTKVPTTAPVFNITGTGTAKGVFLVLGSGALNTKDNTAGTLYSAGLFTGGDQAVVNTNTLTVNYTAGM